MASIENMTDDELLAAKMPGERGYVMPALRDPALQNKTKITEDDLISAMDVQPSYRIGQPDIKTEDEIIQEEMEARRLAESIGRRREESEPGLMDPVSDFVSEFPSRVARGADELYPEGTQARGVFDLATGAAKGAGQLIGSAQAAKTRALMDPETAAEEAKEFGTKVVEGDPQAQEEALIAASMSMVPGVQDAADIELARRDVKKAIETGEAGDIATAGVSTVFAALPLVAVGLTKGVTKAKKLDDDELFAAFPESFRTTDGYRFYKVKTEDGFEYRDSLDPDRYDMSVKPEQLHDMFEPGQGPIPDYLISAARLRDKNLPSEITTDDGLKFRKIETEDGIEYRDDKNDMSFKAEDYPEVVELANAMSGRGVPGDMIPTFPAPKPEPVFESVLEKAVVGLKQDKISINQVESTLQSIAKKQGAGITTAEIESTRLREFLDEAKESGRKSITKDELIDHLEKNKVEINEVRLGGKGDLVDPERFEKAQSALKAAHDDVATDFEKFADRMVEHRKQGFERKNLERAEIGMNPEPYAEGSFEGTSRRAMFDRLRDNPMMVYDFYDNRVQKAAYELLSRAGNALDAVGEVPNTNRAPFDRATIAKGPIRSYDEMSMRELTSMANRLTDDDGPVNIYENSNLYQKINDYAEYQNKEGLLATFKELDRKFKAEGKVSPLDYYNVERQKMYGTSNFIQPKDAELFDEITKDFYAYNDVGIGPGMADLLFPEKVAELDRRLADIQVRYSTGKYSDTDEIKAFLLRIGGMRSDIAKMQAPGGLFSIREAVERFTTADSFINLRNAKNELSRASKTTGQARPPRWEDYTLPGGRNYQEILLGTPDYGGKAFLLESEQTRLKKNLDEIYERQQIAIDEGFEAKGLPGDEKLTAALENQIANNELEIDALRKRQGGQETFYESHFSEYPNVMVHIRTTDRVDDKGRKILFVEEVQSDWHQKGRKRGYAYTYVPPVTNELRDAARAVDEIQNQIDRLPEFRFPRNYNLGTDVAQYLDPSVGTVQSTEELIPYGSSWLDGFTNTPRYEMLPPREKSALHEFVDLNEERLKRKPLVDQLRNRVQRLVELSQDTVSPIRLDANPRYVRGDGYIQELEETHRLHSSEGVPDAPFKKTEEWLGLAVKRIMREASDKGYDGVAFVRGVDASSVVGMPEAAADEFYDKILPSVVKRQTKGKVSKTTIGIPKDTSGYYPEDENVVQQTFNFIELTPKVKDRVSKPQRLFEIGIGAAVGSAGVKAARGEEVSDEET